MEKVARYCQELAKTYETDDVNSSRASKIRKKIRSMLLELEKGDEDLAPLMRVFWSTAYYSPLAKYRGSKDDASRRIVDVLSMVFCGEIQGMLAVSSRYASFYNLWLGDLHRYMSSEVLRSLAEVYYQKCIEIDPDEGRAYNQLMLVLPSGPRFALLKLRYAMLSWMAENRFPSAERNMEASLTLIPDDPTIELAAAKVVGSLVLHYSESEFRLAAAELKDLLQKENQQVLLRNPRLPLAVSMVGTANRMAFDKFGNDAFFKSMEVTCDVFLILLEQNFLIPNEIDEEDRLMMARRKLRRNAPGHEHDDDEEDETDGSDDEGGSSSASSSSKGDGEKDESKESGDEDVQENERATVEKEIEESSDDERQMQLEYLLLAAACEWIFYAFRHIEQLKKDAFFHIKPSDLQRWEQLNERVVEQLNRTRKATSRVQPNVDEETSWMLHGPVLSPSRKWRPLNQLVYWSQELSAAENSPIEKFVPRGNDAAPPNPTVDVDEDPNSLFRRRPSVRRLKMDVLARKMREQLLLSEAKCKTEDVDEVKETTTRSDWKPVYVVVDYEAITMHLQLATKLIASDQFIFVVPSFVIAQLDRMKHTGLRVRAAMREIQRGQSRNRVRVVAASTIDECSELLIASAREHGDASSPEHHSVLVALLVDDLDHHQATVAQYLAVYHIVAFHDRFTRDGTPV